MLGPARVRADVRVRDRQPSRAALRLAAPPPVALVANLALLGLGRSTSSPSPCSSRCSRRRHSPARPAAAAAAGPVLRPRHGVDRRRALGPDPPRDARRLGEGRGDPEVQSPGADAADLDLARRRGRAARRLARAGRRRRSRSSSTRAGRDLPGAPGRARRREFELLKLRTMHTGNDPVASGTPVLAGDPRVTRVGGLLRRFSLDELPNLVNVLRGEMSHRRPAADAAPRRSSVHAAPAPPARGQARASPAGRRSTAGPGSPGRSGSSSTSGTSTTARSGSTCGSSPAPRVCWSPATGSTGSFRRHAREGRGDPARLPSRRRRGRAPLVQRRAGHRGPRRQPRLVHRSTTPRGWVERAMDTSTDRKWAIMIDGADAAGGLRRPVRARPPDSGPSSPCWSATRRPGARASPARPSARRATAPSREHDAHRIHAEIPATNEAAQKVVTFLGFQLRGRHAGRDRARRRARSTTRSGACSPEDFTGWDYATAAELIADSGAAALSDDFFRCRGLPGGRGRHPHPAACASTAASRWCR